MATEQKVFDSYKQAGVEIHSGRTIQKVHCPKCHDNRKNKRDKSLSVNCQKGVWLCHHCGWTAGVSKPDWKPDFARREYTKPEERELPLGDRIVKFFEKRGIEKRVLEYFRIGESNEQNQPWINFPYYRAGELINVKRRNRNKDFRLVGGAELIFYNLDSVFGSDTAVICEGEIDCMTFYQSNIFNVVSVPNGASKGDMKLEYLDNCFEYFDELSTIIIATDGDEPGRALRDELARRLGRGRCKFVEYPNSCKDANEVLLKFGAKAVKELIENAKDFPVEGISTPEDYLTSIYDIFDNGFPKGDKIGHAGFDDLLSFRPGEVTAVTGIPNSGKSAFLDHVSIRLMNRFNWRFGVLSTESYPYSVYMTKLIQAFAGKPLKSLNKSDIDPIVRKFFQAKLFLFGIEDRSLKSVLGRAKELVLRKGINALVLDPWNTLELDSSKGSELEKIKEGLKEIVLFAKQHMVHVFIVAHPTKMPVDQKTGAYLPPKLYNISGSADFFNMIDNGFVVYRNLGTKINKTNKFLGDTVTINVEKVKQFFIGHQGSVTFDCNFSVGNYCIENGNLECEYDLWKEKQKGETKSLFDDPPETTLPPMEFKTKESLQKLNTEIKERFPEVQRFPTISTTNQIRSFDADWTIKEDAPF